MPVLDPPTETAVGVSPQKSLVAIEEMHSLCRAWNETKETSAFSALIKLCLDKQLMVVADFRDYFHAMPVAVVMWGEGTAKPPLRMQKEIVEFIDRSAAKLPLRKVNLEEMASIERQRRRRVIPHPAL